MGQGRALYSEEQIIAAGEKLERETGVEVDAWAVFKALGSRGKYERIELIWEKHVASRGAAATPAAAELPEQLLAGLDAAIGSAAASIRALIAGENARQTASHVRQIQRLESQHADEIDDLRKAIARLEEENGNWRAEASRLGDREEELLQELEREQALRRSAEEAASRASVLPWPVPIVGRSVPLVSPVQTAPAAPPARPAPIASPVRRGRSRAEARPPAAGEDAAAKPEPDAAPGPVLVANQMKMPI